MKYSKLKILSFFAVAAVVTMVVAACKKSFLDQQTVGILTETEAQSLKGAQQFLTASYAGIKGIGWEGGASNWVYGSIVAGEANKGSDAGDQADIVPIQQFTASPTNNYFNVKWRAVYEGVARTNGTIRIVTKLTAADITTAEKNQILAEARFLRAFFHFEAKKMWNKVPYVDETIDVTNANVPNDTDIWPKIMADLDFARTTLTATKSEIGRINKWGAIAFYAKALLFQGKYAEARPLLTDVITNGVNSAGTKYALAPAFHNLFNADFENTAAVRAETIFAYESSVNDGSGGVNANFDQVLNFPYNGGPGTCCGFYQPSIELVNSYRTTALGLPLLDGSYNIGANQVKNDQGVASTAPFTPDAGTLDPRLDWTVGRRGLPFHDWGLHPGAVWIRDQGNGGPYAPKKNAYYKTQEKKLTDGTNWATGLTAINYKLMRFADVLLMAAEAEIDGGGTPEKAREYINLVRARAAQPSTFVPGAAATYLIGLYATPFPDLATARSAVRFERKLELAMEGHRFFDLVRWGIADVAINAFLTYEKAKLSAGYGSATFTKGKHEYYPIPQRQIDLQASGGAQTLVQNPGYQ
ncbi:MAG: RagB/SusD family nutrient uptake outer membrane protein [Chitinophagaceae bacterium]|nr:RagB/SusD family nutrient uptake outer membrane protein [Chitinophagaceae bacterium]